MRLEKRKVQKKENEKKMRKETWLQFQKRQKETWSAIRKNGFSLPLFIGWSFSFAFPR
jgi:hypothetical protein